MSKTKKSCQQIVQELEERRYELEQSVENIRTAIVSEKRAMSDEERNTVECCELELRSIIRKISAEVQKEKMASLPAQAMDANAELRNFIRNAKPGQSYVLPAHERGITTSGGGAAVQGLVVRDIVDVDRKDQDLFSVLGIEIPTGVSGGAIQWPYMGGISVVIADELASSTDRTPDLSKQQAIPVRLTAKVPISNQTMESNGFDLVEYIRRGMGSALRKKLNYAACSTEKAASNFYGGFANTTESGTYGQSGYTAGKQSGTYKTLSYSTFTEMLGKLAARSIPVDQYTAFVIGGDDFWKLKGTPRDSGSGLMVIDDDNRIAGVPVIVSNNINKTTDGSAVGATHNIGLGNFSYLPVLNHGNIRITVDSTSATAGDTDSTIVIVNADFSMTVNKEVQDAFVLYTKSAT